MFVVMVMIVRMAVPVVMPMAAAMQVIAVRMAIRILVAVSGQAVLAFDMGEGHTKIAARTDPGHPHRPLR